MTDTIFFAISMMVAIPILYCEYKIEENRFNDKKFIKYWVGLSVGFFIMMCVNILWIFMSTRCIK
jgi:hypothetical protein